jgi:arginine-tRNA-protein transferase
MNRMDMRSENIRVYLSTSHPCPYLPEEIATSLIIDPDLETDQYRLTQLTQNGFRRSGDLIYRPHCPNCRACVSVRIPTELFRPNRSQRRNLQRNHDIEVNAISPAFKEEHFEMYVRYQQARHPGSDMCDQNPDKYHQFLVANGRNSVFFEFRVEASLVAVSVVDVLLDGLSAVYTFFEPDYHKRSLGTFAILWETEEARRRNMDWLYLGYWIDECDKMAYKTNFRPIQGFRNGSWRGLC